MSLRLPAKFELWRVRRGGMGSDPSYGANGCFTLPSTDEHRPLDLIISDGKDPEGRGWEHVSVKVRVGPYTYTPSWDEMQWVRDQLWEPEDTVLQIHPPKSQYISRHPNVLHLWRNTRATVELPPRNLIA